MATYSSSQLSLLTLRAVHPSLPIAIDDVSFAYGMGIRPKTLWWAVRGCRVPAGEPGSLYHKAAILKRGRAGKRGALRQIHIPDRRLRNIQKVLAETYVKPIPVGDHVRAYEPGVKPLDTAKLLAGSKILLSFDLKNFFGSIRLAWVRAYYQHLGYPRQVANIIAQLCCVTDIKSGGGNRTVRFVPQGTVLSPSLANRMADWKLDEAILALSDAGGWTYTRYSDNIYMGHPTLLNREDTDRFKDSVLAAVSASGWGYHKVRVAPHWKRQVVLGAVVNEKANLAQEQYRVLRAVLHNCLVHGFQSQVDRARSQLKHSITSPDTLILHLRGRLAYVKGLLTSARYDVLLESFQSALEAHRILEQQRWAVEDATDKADALAKRVLELAEAVK